jgi:predicted lipoprotein with Yx(FWY)xxD motif
MITKSTMWLASVAVFIIFAAGCGSSSPGSNGCTTSITAIITQAGTCPNTSSSPGATASSGPVSGSPVPYVGPSMTASSGPVVPPSSGPVVSPSSGPVVSPSSVPVSASPSSASPIASGSMPLATATLLGSPGFIDPSGSTAYVFDGDLTQANASTCNGNCAVAWPPISPPSGTLPSGWTSFTRQDGTTQLAYKGRALYTYSGDTAAGTTNGDGLNQFGGIWHVARP